MSGVVQVSIRSIPSDLWQRVKLVCCQQKIPVYKFVILALADRIKKTER